MAGGLGGTISGLIMDILTNRFDVVLSMGEVNAIVVFSGLVVAYLMPEVSKVAKDFYVENKTDA
jgi:uncharacterized membrane protein YeiH